MDYAQSHSVVMASVADLHIIRFDQAWAKDGHVLLRYTAEGSHCGKPYKGMEKTGRKARWAAAAIFEVKEGKIWSFTKDWDQKTMQVSSCWRYWFCFEMADEDKQIQLGWAPVKDSDDPRWNAEALADFERSRKKAE